MLPEYHSATWQEHTDGAPPPAGCTQQGPLRHSLEISTMLMAISLKTRTYIFLNHGFTMDTLNLSQYDFELIVFFKNFKNILWMMILNISNVVHMPFIFCWENEKISMTKTKNKTIILDRSLNWNDQSNQYIWWTILL